MDFFTADPHYYHKNVITLCNRPFANLDEMHEKLINNWNARVTDSDTVYVLGDFCFGGHNKALSIIRQLNGLIKFIPGSHDEWLSKSYLIELPRISILEPLISIEYKEYGGKERPLVVVLCHYSLRTWDRSHYGSLHLYGHSHGNLPPLPRSMDVGVDCNNYFPVSLTEIIKKLNSPGKSIL